MSLSKDATLPGTAAVLFGLGFVLCIHQYSITTHLLAQVEVAASPAPPPLPPELVVPPSEPEKGRMTYMTCIGCHGKDGEGGKMFNSPRLAGQTPWYLRKQLFKFKDGVRGTHSQDLYGMQMAPMAKLLFTNEIIHNVIAYMGSLQPAKPIDTGPADASKGQHLFTVCAGCHGADAQGISQHKAPKLTGQHSWYLAKQLNNIKAGIRGSHEADAEGRLMLPMANTLANQAPSTT